MQPLTALQDPLPYSPSWPSASHDRPWRPGSLLLVLGIWTLIALLVSTSVLFDAANTGERISYARIALGFMEGYL